VHNLVPQEPNFLKINVTENLHVQMPHFLIQNLVASEVLQILMLVCAHGLFRVSPKHFRR